MAELRLPPDFIEFLRLLDSHRVEYLLIGGYAVAYHGYPRATGDMDVWVRVTPDNAAKLARAVREFGFESPELSTTLFLEPDRMIRMGTPPIRIEIATGISGVKFEDCYARRIVMDIQGLPVGVIGLDDLRANKQAAGRHKDLDDLEHLR